MSGRKEKDGNAMPVRQEEDTHTVRKRPASRQQDENRGNRKERVVAT